MSELAFNMNGEPFEVPPTATGWRVRRLKVKGAPEVVYSREGTPLMLPIDAGIDELRNAVGAPGRYRVDPVDEFRPIANAPAGYVFLHDDAPVAPAPIAAPQPPVNNDNIVIEALRMNAEAVRMNAEIAKAVVDRFPQMMESSAVVLRAADAAGLPSREPRGVNDDEDDDTDDAAPESASSPMFEIINQIVAQVVPIIVTSLATKGLPKLGAVLDWRKAIPASNDATIASEPPVAQPAPVVVEHPPMNPETFAKVMAVQAQLTPDEAARARQLGAQLSPTELRAFFEQLAIFSVPEAVARVRSLIGGGE